MRTFWLSVMLAVSACDGEVAGAPAPVDDVVSAGELPPEAADWLQAGHEGELLDGDQLDVLVPVVHADGSTTDEPMILTWHAEQAEPSFGPTYAAPINLGTATGYASVSACFAPAASSAAFNLANSRMATNCLAMAFSGVSCTLPGLPLGVALGTPTVTTALITMPSCGGPLPPHIGWTATANVSATCWGSCSSDL